MPELVKVMLCQRCQRRLTGRRSFRQPEIPDDQEHSNDPDQPERVFDSSRLHGLPSDQARYQLREEDNEKDDHGSAPKESDAQSASLLALIAPNVQLNEPNAEQDA